MSVYYQSVVSVSSDDDNKVAISPVYCQTWKLSCPFIVILLSVCCQIQSFVVSVLSVCNQCVVRIQFRKGYRPPAHPWPYEDLIRDRGVLLLSPKRCPYRPPAHPYRYLTQDRGPLLLRLIGHYPSSLQAYLLNWKGDQCPERNPFYTIF